MIWKVTSHWHGSEFPVEHPEPFPTKEAAEAFANEIFASSIMVREVSVEEHDKTTHPKGRT